MKNTLFGPSKLRWSNSPRLFPKMKKQQFVDETNSELSSRSYHRTILYRKYFNKLAINPDLTRSLVSFQANKRTPFYRWLKYKEAFSSTLVSYFLNRCRPTTSSKPKILDPFAGVGTTLTTAAREGWQSTGIELLPVGVTAIRARVLADRAKIRSFQYYLEKLINFSFESSVSDSFHFHHIRITEKAFPQQTEKAIAAYRSFLEVIKSDDVRFLFWFACLSVLEDVSYTRKDGQYLRWDSRSRRKLRSKFNKGHIPDFKSAIIAKLKIMLEDMKEQNADISSSNIRIIEGSCLTELPLIDDSYFDLVITSPPYCNRYDYTRTYALELAFMGFDEEAVKNLRQTLLSCTVENKTKRNQLEFEYRKRKQERRYLSALNAFDKQQALQEVLNLLNRARHNGELNNSNIPTLVENYFFEMNLVIQELSRVIVPGGHIVMVNDNVQYNGEEVPVDLILSDFASSAGLLIDHIWVLQRGKGNSSQQMGSYGRKEIRKCVYVWSKPIK